MQSAKLPQKHRHTGRYLLALLLGIVLAMGILPPAPATALKTPIPTEGQNNPNQITNFVSAAVELVGPAVVRIDTERTITQTTDPLFDDPSFRHFFGLEESPTPRKQQILRGEGSGFIIDSTGIILTNAHVVNQATKVSVRLKDSRTFLGTVLGTDEITDLAVVKINATGLPVAPLGDSNRISVGDWAIAVGNPLGLDNTVTLGIISTLKRSSAAIGIPDKRLDFIQTDAAINPGNSGGPLLNATGEVIGINTAIRAGATGIGFAIPINKAKTITSQLIEGKKVQHPFIGIQMLTLTPELALENNSEPNTKIILPAINGVLITGILPNSPAEIAGLQPTDIITALDNTPITRAEQLQTTVENSGINKKLNLTVIRKNQTQQITVTTAQIPPGK